MGPIKQKPGHGPPVVPDLSPLSWLGGPPKTQIDKAKRKRAPTYSNLSNLEDLVKGLNYCRACCLILTGGLQMDLSGTRQKSRRFRCLPFGR